MEFDRRGGVRRGQTSNFRFGRFLLVVLTIGVAVFAIVKETHIADTLLQSETPATATFAPNPDLGALKNQINDVLNRWAEAHLGTDMSARVPFYSPIVNQYFGRKHVSRTSIGNKSSSSGELTHYSIENISYSTISATNAVVRLEKVWSFNPDGVDPHHTQSELMLQYVQGEWLITSERDLSDRIEVTAKPEDQTPVASNLPEDLPPSAEENLPTGVEPSRSQDNLKAEPLDITGVLVRVDPREAKIYYRITSPVEGLPSKLSIGLYNDSGAENFNVSRLSVQFPQLERGQSGNVEATISYSASEQFDLLSALNGRGQASQVFCYALRARFAGYAGILLRKDNVNVRLRFPCQ